MQNIVKTNVCSPLTDKLRWAIMAWGSSAVQDTGKRWHHQDLPWSLTLFFNTAQENRTEVTTTKLALSQLSPQTSFFHNFHNRMGANMHDGPVRSHQNKMCGIQEDLTSPCLPAFTVIHGAGRQKLYSVKEQSCTPRNRKAEKNKPGSDSGDFTREARICWPYYILPSFLSLISAGVFGYPLKTLLHGKSWQALEQDTQGWLSQPPWRYLKDM